MKRHHNGIRHFGGAPVTPQPMVAEDPIKTQHGCSETHVVCRYSSPVTLLMLTPAQCREHIAAMQASLDALEKFQVTGEKPVPSAP